MSTRPLVAAISESCWRSAFMGTLSPMMRWRPVESCLSWLFSSARAWWARAFLTTTETLSMESGFSRKSKAPSLVALTAASMLPWPEITTTSGRSANGMRLDALEDLHTVDAGQPDIEQHQLEAGAGKGVQAGFAAFRGIGAIAFVLEHAGQRAADFRLVVHHQDAPLLHAFTGAAGCACGAGVLDRLRIDGHWNLDGEARAGRQVVFHAYVRVVLGHDVADDGEAQAGAAPLGGEIGQEEFFLFVGADAAAGIGHHQLDRIGRARLGGDVKILDERILHGFGGVIDQVHHHALELLAVEVDRRQVGGEAGAQVDAESRRP